LSLPFAGGGYFCEMNHENIALIKKRTYSFRHSSPVNRAKKRREMLTAMKNVFMSYLLSLAEVHPEVTRF